MNNSLRGINSRRADWEEWIGDLEEKMVDITSPEQNIGKTVGKKKKMKTLWETTGTTLNTPTFELQGSQKEKKERNDLRKYLKR